MKRVGSILVIIIVTIVGISHALLNHVHTPLNLAAVPKATAVGQAQHELNEATTPFTVPIFIYHTIRPQKIEKASVDEYDTTPELLEQQLNYLKDNGYTTISPDDLVKYVTTNAKRPEKPVWLTFDDGRISHYDIVFPLLKKYGMTATFYVFTHAMDKNPNYMTWAELKEMDAAGMTIASHTVTHPYLNKATPEELTKEMVDSKKDLEEHLGKPIIHFASPFGYMSKEIEDAAKTAGYTTARSIRSLKPLTKDDLINLPGIIVSDSFASFVRTLEHTK